MCIRMIRWRRASRARPGSDRLLGQRRVARDRARSRHHPCAWRLPASVRRRNGSRTPASHGSPPASGIENRAISATERDSASTATASPLRAWRCRVDRSGQLARFVLRRSSSAQRSHHDRGLSSRNCLRCTPVALRFGSLRSAGDAATVNFVRVRTLALPRGWRSVMNQGQRTDLPLLTRELRHRRPSHGAWLRGWRVLHFDLHHDDVAGICAGHLEPR